MEVVFCNSERFFTHRHQKPNRKRQYFPKSGNHVGRHPRQPQRSAAEREEIDHRAQEDGQEHKDAKFPLARRNNEEEKSGCSNGPKQEVQRPAQQSQPQPPPQQAQ